MLARQTLTRLLSTALISLSVLLSLNSCSKKKSNPAPAMNETPWDRAGTGVITPEIENRITQTVRVLAFDDGVVISYDGESANPQDQEVCREEEHDGQEIKVCMDLEDDGLPPSAISNTPLTGTNEVVGYEGVDSFSDVLTCYVDGVRQFNCNAVFETISEAVGDDFSCQANLYNGDKALSCSDNWAITVSESSEDTASDQEKTICRINTEDGTGRCLSAPKRVDTDDDGIPDAPAELEDLIMQMQTTRWAGYESAQVNTAQLTYDNVLAVRTFEVEEDDEEAEEVEESEFANAPMDAEITYVSIPVADNDADSDTDDDDRLCTVDVDTGEITVVSSGSLTTEIGTCRIEVTVSAEGFVDRVFIAELEVAAANDATWTGYATPTNNFYPGEDSSVVSLNNPSDGSLSPARYAYTSETPTICTVDGTNGELTAVAEGECTIQLDVSGDGFLDAEIDATVTVSGTDDFTAVTWDSFPTSATVGTPIDVSSILPVADPVNDVDSSANALEITASGGCRYDDTGGSAQLIFDDDTDCVVTVTASGRGYNDKSETFTIAADAVTEGVQTATQGIVYRGSLRVAGELAIFAAPTSSAGAASITYSAAGSDSLDAEKADVCSVDPSSGTISAGSAAIAGDKCSISAVLSVSGYGDVTVNLTDAIVLIAAAGTQTAPSGWTDPYGASPAVVVGEDSDPPGTPTSSGTGALEYRVQAGGEGCTVHHSTGVVTGVNTNGGCAIEAQYLGDMNTAPSPWAEVATITITIGDQGDPAEANIYTAGSSCSAVTSVKMGAVSTAPCGLPMLSMNTAGAEFELQAWDQADPSGGALATGCSVDEEGLVTGLVSGSTCFIHARFAAVANRFTESDWVNVSGSSGITIADGEMTGITWEPSQATGTVGDVITLDPVNLGSDPSAAGADVAYSLENSQSSCSITDRAVSASGAATCTVTATISKTDYDEVSKTHDVVFSGRTSDAMLIEWSGYDSGVITYGDAAPSEVATPITNPAASTVTYTSTNTNVCTVDGNGALTIKAGGSCIITLGAVEDADSSNSATRVFTIRVNKVAQTLAAVELYSVNSLRVGENADLTAAFTAGGHGDLVLRTTNQDICSVAPLGGLNAGRVTATGGGTCQIQARWGGDAQHAPSNWASIAGADGIEIEATDQTAPTAWNEAYGFAPSVRVGDSIALKPDVVPDRADGSGAYQYNVKSGEKHCEVAPEGQMAGRVAGLAPGSCVIEVRYGGNDNYNPSPYVELATINILPAQLLAFASTPSLTYALDTLQVGSRNTRDPVGLTGRVNSDDNNVSVFWVYQVSGSDGSSAKEGVCELSDPNPYYDADSDPSSPDVPGNPDHGKIVVGSAAAAGDQCIVEATAYTLERGYLPYFGVEATLAVNAADTFTSIAWADWRAEGDTGATYDFSSAQPSADPIQNNFLFSDDGGCTWAGNVLTYRSTPGDCTITVTAQRDGYTDFTQDFTVTVAHAISTVAPVYTAAFRVGGDTITPTPASGTGNGGSVIAIVYSAQGFRGTNPTASICSMSDSATGEIAPGSAAQTGDICRVTATYTSTDHHTVTETVNVTVAAGAIEIARGNIPNSGTVGTSSATIALAGAQAPSVDPSDADLAFTKQSGSCTLTGTNLVLGGGTTNCVIRVTATKTNYTTDIENYTIAVNAGTQTAFTWTTYSPATLQVGSGAAANPPASLETLHSTTNGRTVSYTKQSGSCSVSPRGVVSPVAEASLSDCVVTATISQVGYADLTNPYTVAITAGTLSITGTLTYPNEFRIGGGRVEPSDAPISAGATIRYAVTREDASDGTDQGSGEVCTVRPSGGNAGRVIMGSDLAVGDECDITVTISRDGYTSVPQTATLTALEGRITSTRQPVYPSLIPVNGAVYQPATRATASAGSASATVRYTGAQGWRSNTSTSDICALVSGTNGSDNGHIELGTDVQNGDVCRVDYVFSATGFGATLGSVQLSIANGTLDFASNGNDDSNDGDGRPTYSASNPTGGTAGTSGNPTTPAGSEDDNGIEVTWSAWVVTASGSGSSANPCTIDGNGDVTFPAGMVANDTCEVKATASADGYDDLEVVIHTFTAQ